jgi:hypothetical protein
MLCSCRHDELKILDKTADQRADTQRHVLAIPLRRQSVSHGATPFQRTYCRSSINVISCGFDNTHQLGDLVIQLITRVFANPSK